MNWTNRCHFGDCRDTMRRMIADGVRVQCIVTSPPYWGLRDYGVDGQIGLEPTLSEFLAQLVEVFDLCRELLADDGTLWLNMGDSYANGGRKTRGTDDKLAQRAMDMRPADPVGIKPKDLIGQPWRLAFALQDAGWYLRQDIIWSKPNPMPESVRDRCTKSHEYLFLLSKSERYFIAPEGMKEPAVSTHVPGNNSHKGATAYAEQAGEFHRTKAGLVAYAQRQRSKRDSFKRDGSKREQGIPGQAVGTHRPDRAESEWDVSRRNRRSVWTIPTQAYRGAHFATFPEALVEPCVLAGSRPGDIVFDPFFGTGTVGRVALRLGRQFIGCELNFNNAALQDDRLRGVTAGLHLEHVE